VKVLTSANAAGFSPLHQALKAGNIDNIRLYLELLRGCAPDLQVKVLTSANAAGFTPLHQALRAGNTENVRLYLDRIQYLLDKNILKRLLYAKNRSGYTSMHQLLCSKNAIVISKMLIVFVKRNFCEDDANTIIQFLLYTRISNYLPSANKKTLGDELAHEIDAYLYALRRAYPERRGFAAPVQRPSRSFGNSSARDLQHGRGSLSFSRAASANHARSGAGRDQYFPSDGRGGLQTRLVTGVKRSSDNYDSYDDRGPSKRFESAPSSEGRGDRRGHGRFSSNRAANASGSHPARFGDNYNRVYANSSPPQAGLGARDVRRSQSNDDGLGNNPYRRS
jgi:hypothetical protein